MPQPNLHFPFKYQNRSRILYGRGKDENGQKFTFLTVTKDTESEIGIDQFGKGYVLKAGAVYQIILGIFEDSPIM